MRVSEPRPYCLEDGISSYLALFGGDFLTAVTTIPNIRTASVVI